MDLEHRLDANAPFDMQVSRDGLAIQLSEHDGDRTPRSVFLVSFAGVREPHEERKANHYGYWHPGARKVVRRDGRS
jgi:hypothetical protein